MLCIQPVSVSKVYKHQQKASSPLKSSSSLTDSVSFGSNLGRPFSSEEKKVIESIASEAKQAIVKARIIRGLSVSEKDYDVAGHTLIAKARKQVIHAKENYSVIFFNPTFNPDDSYYIDLINSAEQGFRISLYNGGISDFALLKHGKVTADKQPISEYIIQKVFKALEIKKKTN